ncbi:MAG: hypothetical protein CMJ76_00815 [Planctomycetaceae bacterium]|nr:hypothetical protein [Planctomycetaceae bacterium]
MNLLFNATLAHYRSRKAEALANLDLYFNHSVGIGEHSDLQEELTKWTEVLATAEDCLKTLERNFDNGAIRLEVHTVQANAA